MSVADTLNLMSALYNSDNFRFLKYFYKNIGFGAGIWKDIHFMLMLLLTSKNEIVLHVCTYRKSYGLLLYCFLYNKILGLMLILRRNRMPGFENCLPMLWLLGLSFSGYQGT